MRNLTTLCYIEQNGKYLMLHRVKKKKDVNQHKWIGVGGLYAVAVERELVLKKHFAFFKAVRPPPDKHMKMIVFLENTVAHFFCVIPFFRQKAGTGMYPLVDIVVYPRKTPIGLFHETTPF